MGITASFVLGLHKEIVKFMSLHYAARIRPIPYTPGERDEAQHWHQILHSWSVSETENKKPEIYLTKPKLLILKYIG